MKESVKMDLAKMTKDELSHELTREMCFMAFFVENCGLHGKDMDSVISIILTRIREITAMIRDRD